MFLSVVNCFADDEGFKCMKAATDDHSYQEQNYHKQISDDEYKRLDEQGKREARIRNLCFGASVSWHTFCAWSKCHNDGVSRSIKGITLEQYCKWSDTDCFTENVDVIFSVLQESNEFAFRLFFSDTDINNITSDILNGKTINTVIIDIDKSVCYKTDNNGDTVWHAFARSNRDAWSFANLCVSLNENPLDMFINAVSKTKNKKGRTAVQEAIDSSNPENIFGFLSAYARQEKKDYCNSLPQDISKTNNIDLKKVKTLLKCGA